MVNTAQVQHEVSMFKSLISKSLCSNASAFPLFRPTRVPVMLLDAWGCASLP